MDWWIFEEWGMAAAQGPIWLDFGGDPAQGPDWTVFRSRHFKMIFWWNILELDWHEQNPKFFGRGMHSSECSVVHYLLHVCCSFGVDAVRYSDYVKSLNVLDYVSYRSQQESLAAARKPRDAAAVLFGLKFADNIHYKFKSSQASNARLQSSKHTGTKQNLRQNGDSRSFKVTCFGVSVKAIRH